MTPAWFLTAPGLAALFVLMVVLVLGFLRVKSLRERVPAEEAPAPATQEAVEELASEIGELRSRLDEVEQRRGPMSDWATAAPASVNLNRRGQVLRLYRRGDTVAHIASTLGLSTGEVALIVKVQKMTTPAHLPENLGE